MTFEPTRAVVWFSAGVTSAIAAKLTIEKYKNIMPVVLVNTDTGSEHPDNFRFISDCEKWLNHKVTILHNPKYENTLDVYRKERFLVSPQGARCTLGLKKRMRQQFEDLEHDIQIFGYDCTEGIRVKRFIKNNPEVHGEFPLLTIKITKNDCFSILLKNGIKRPLTYDLGFKNANCLNTGCVKGGAGYWNFYRKFNPDGFAEMAKIERELNATILKGVFLDELNPTVGNYTSEANFQCGLFCGL